MKKTLFSLIIFFSFFFTLRMSAQAACVARTGDTCGDSSMPFLCSASGSNYCCSGINECASLPSQTCVNGEADNELFCDPASTVRVMICRAGAATEYVLNQTCTGTQICSNGACVDSTSIPTRCSDGTLIGNYTCFNSQPHICELQGNNAVLRRPQGAACSANQTCQGAGICVDNAQPSPSGPNPTQTNPPPPPDPLVPDWSFLILTNPLTIDGGNCTNLLTCTIADPLGVLRTVQYGTPGGILSALLPWLFTFAGLILFVMLLWGGFEMLSGAATPQSQQAGKARITAALTGFALLFMSYWFAQIIEYIFGLNIL